MWRRGALPLATDVQETVLCTQPVRRDFARKFADVLMWLGWCCPQMHNAATVAGMAFANAYLGACHSMASEVSQVSGAHLGLLAGVLLPHVLAFMAKDPVRGGMGHVLVMCLNGGRAAQHPSLGGVLFERWNRSAAPHFAGRKGGRAPGPCETHFTCLSSSSSSSLHGVHGRCRGAAAVATDRQAGLVTFTPVSLLACVPAQATKEALADLSDHLHVGGTTVDERYQAVMAWVQSMGTAVRCGAAWVGGQQRVEQLTFNQAQSFGGMQ